MFNTKKFEKGITLYFTLVIMSVLFGIGIGLNTIILSQTKMTREIGYSVLALLAADTGIEKALYFIYKQNITPPFNFSDYLDLNKNQTQDPGEPTFQVNAFLPDQNCSAQYYCINSIGIYRGTRRALDVSY